MLLQLRINQLILLHCVFNYKLIFAKQYTSYTSLWNMLK